MAFRFENLDQTRHVPMHTSQHAFNEAYERPATRVADRTEHRRHESDQSRKRTSRSAQRSLDCSSGCPFRDTNSARSEMRRGESDVFSRSEAKLLRNFDPDKPMSDKQHDAVSKLIKHAMDVGPDGKPLWTSYAPEDPEARARFKSMIFGGNADYQTAVRNSGRDDISESVREQHYETIRNYGEDFSSMNNGGGGGFSPTDSISYNTSSIYPPS